jgi:hypothetical protein
MASNVERKHATVSFAVGISSFPQAATGRHAEFAAAKTGRSI